ncbi:glycosyltransferase family 4 protein [Candidatus Saccharibacteria bacterium]|nr:glycosyltransferase family 4 protein [Candidatus Saccharibacteria bacterium]
MKNKPLKILFDANPLVNGNKSGVGYYTQGLVQALADNYPTEIELVGHYFSFLGRKDKIALPTAQNIRYVRSKLVPGKILSITRKLGFQLPLELFFKQRGDVALFTNFVSLPSITNIPIIVAVHDLCFEDVPQYVAEKNRSFLRRFVPRSISTAKLVITISETTKLAIKHRYQTDDNKFVITPIPPSSPVHTKQTSTSSFGIKKDYVLFVSTLEPRKNVINLVKAYEQLSENIRDTHQLVLAGGQGWYMEETLTYIKNLQGNGYGIILAGYVSDVQRAELYTNTKLFVVPSHYEGFGMPILEAMSYGVPTAVSDIPVFHEVAENASLYFDKDNPGAIAEAITTMLDSIEVREKYIKLGNERLKNYDWQVVAEKLLSSIKQLR